MIHLTPETIAVIAACAPRATLAASKVGVSRRCLYQWLERGEMGERPYADLYRAWEAIRLSKTGRRPRKERKLKEMGE